jgi:RecB family exonuclease
VLEYITPTRYTAIRRCPLQVAYDLAAAQGGPARPNAAALPGIAAHNALEALVARRVLQESDLAALAAAAWHSAICEALGIVGSPREVARIEPGYYIFAARLAKTAQSLARLVVDADTCEPELGLSSRDGLIRGRADLVVVQGDDLWVADYKSKLRDPASNSRVEDEYTLQLRLYAYLLHQQLGRWPSRGVLLPLDGPPVNVHVDPESSEAVAEDARRTLTAFQALSLGAQPARPSPAACRFCPHAASCSPFADSLSPDWAAELLACIGIVQAVEGSRRGGFAVSVEIAAGSLDEMLVWIVRVPADSLPDSAEALVGTRIVALGLAPTGQKATYRLTGQSVLVSGIPHEPA